MATILEMLNEDMRAVLAHMQAFPGDKCAEEKYAILEQAIEANTPRVMSHQRKRVDLDDLIKNPPAPYDWAKSKYAVQHPCRVCDHQTSCPDCVQASKAAILGRNLILPEAAEMHARTRKAIDEVVNRPRFTFGADYEQDQLWLAAEREKDNNGSFIRTPDGVANPCDSCLYPTTENCPSCFNFPRASGRSEPDKMMFPTMAFNLTSIDNVLFGTKNYV
jgi:hypothetical protein